MEALTLTEKQQDFVAGVETGALSRTRFEPSNLGSLMTFAKLVAGSQLCPKHLQGKPGDVALQAMFGAELGLTFMNSMQLLHTIHGKVGMDATLIRAQVQDHPDCEFFEIEDADEKGATLKVRKRGWPEGEYKLVSYTMDDAQRAGNASKDNYRKNPVDMLVARVTTRAARRYFPKAAAGLYTPDEIIESAEVEVKDVTPRESLAAERAKTIVSATRPVTVEIPEAEIVEAGPATEPPSEPSIPALTEEQKSFARSLMKVEGVGEKNSVELASRYNSAWEIGATTEKELTAVPGVGAKTAKALREWAKKNAEPVWPEPTEPEDPDEPTWERIREGQKPVSFRDQNYVEALKEAAKEHGVFWHQVEGKARQLMGWPEGDVDLRKMPDPKWNDLSAWVRSWTQDSLPDVPAEDSGAISAGKARMLANLVKNCRDALPPEEGDDWEFAFSVWREAQFGKGALEEIPAKGFEKVLAWITDNDPRSRRADRP